MVSISVTLQNLMKRFLENFRINMMSGEVGGWMENGENKWCLLLLDIILEYFPKKNYFSLFLAFKSSFGKYMLSLFEQNTEFQTNI